MPSERLPWTAVLLPISPVSDSHFSPRELDKWAEHQTHLEADIWGESHSKKSSMSPLSLFPYLGGKRQL